MSNPSFPDSDIKADRSLFFSVADIVEREDLFMKLHLPPDTEDELRNAISRDDVDRFSELASPLKWGKPSWSASQVLLQILNDDERKQWFWAKSLSGHQDPHTRRYASAILLALWGKDRKKAEQLLTALADDEHWLVREDAHHVWGELLTENFRQVYLILQKFCKSPSPSLRRCVAIAARNAGNLRKEEWAEPLIQLLEPLLSDKTAYVRKNLGPYAIGDGLLRCFPDFTLERLRSWARWDDESTLWNVAMAFASYGGNRNWRQGMKILTKLAADKRRYVWRSAASALLYLARRQPEVRETLNAWLDSPERAKVAETALKYLRAKKG